MNEKALARSRAWKRRNPEKVAVLHERLKERRRAEFADIAAMPKRRWTPEEDALIMSDPRTPRELAWSLRRTPEAIQVRRRRLRS